MDIALCFDKNFAMQAAVTIASISNSNAKDEITFHLLTEGLSDVLKGRISCSLTQDLHKCVFYDIDPDILRDCPVNPNLTCPSLAKYYRLLISRVVSKSIQRILYMDCDIIVVGSLRPIFDVDLKGKAIGVVTDQKPFDIDGYNRLRIELSDGYFNSGVMMMNLDKWRKNNYQADIFEFIKNYGNLLVWEDQDALNRIFAKDKVWLPIEYNLQNDMLLEKNSLYWKDHEKLTDAIKSPVCVHFTGSKPWKSGCSHPWAGIWLDMLKCTSWKDFQPIKTPLKRRIIDKMKSIIAKHITLTVIDNSFSEQCYRSSVIEVGGSGR